MKITIINHQIILEHNEITIQVPQRPISDLLGGKPIVNVEAENGRMARDYIDPYRREFGEDYETAVRMLTNALGSGKRAVITSDRRIIQQ